MRGAAPAVDAAQVRIFRNEVLCWLKAFRGTADRHFPVGLCRDWNLEMLLGLYEASLDAAPMTTKALAEMTGLDQGTALRRLYLLERTGLIERGLDLDDRRRTIVSLSEHGRASVESFVDSFVESLVPSERRHALAKAEATLADA